VTINLETNRVPTLLLELRKLPLEEMTIRFENDEVISDVVDILPTKLSSLHIATSKTAISSAAASWLLHKLAIRTPSLSHLTLRPLRN